MIVSQEQFDLYLAEYRFVTALHGAEAPSVLDAYLARYKRTG